MRLTGVLHKAATDMLELIGPLTKKWSNLPDSYIKRASEQVYYRTPRGLPNYLNRVIARRRYRFTTNRPWTQQFQQQNQNGTHFKRILIEPIRDWSFFKSFILSDPLILFCAFYSSTFTFFRGDRVEVMVGRDKGKQGIVSQVIQERNWVIVEGLNTHYRRVSITIDHISCLFNYANIDRFFFDRWVRRKIFPV